jgi:hypothetical protein
MGKYCVVSADRVCHDIIMMVGTYRECEDKCGKNGTGFYSHPKYGGIDAHIVPYDNFHKKLPHYDNK